MGSGTVEPTGGALHVTCKVKNMAVTFSPLLTRLGKNDAMFRSLAKGVAAQVKAFV